MMSVITLLYQSSSGIERMVGCNQGAIIIAAVALNKFTERSAEKRALKERECFDLMSGEKEYKCHL